MILWPTKHVMAQAEPVLSTRNTEVKHTQSLHLPSSQSHVEDRRNSIVVVSVGRVGSQRMPRTQKKSPSEAEGQAGLFGDSDAVIWTRTQDCEWTHARLEQQARQIHANTAKGAKNIFLYSKRSLLSIMAGHGE